MIMHILEKRPNIKLAINGYWVISIFDVSECCLISPDQHIFQKLPKMPFLNNVLFLFSVVLLNRISRKDQNWWNGALWGDRCHMNSHILQFLKLYHETTIREVYFDQIFFFQKSKLKKPSLQMRFTNPALSVFIGSEEEESKN